MTRARVLALALGALAISGTLSCAQDAGLGLRPWEMEEARKLSEGGTDFAVDLYRTLAEREGNLFFSPLSVRAALGMTAAGARGKTATEMNAVLKFSEAEPRRYETLGLLLRRLDERMKGGFGCELTLASRLWGQAGSGFEREFLALAADHFGGGFEEVDFQRATEEARGRINRWAGEKTRERIKELLKPGFLNSLTRLVLANAIWFRGEWETRFDPAETRPAPFHVSLSESVQVPLMVRTAEYSSGRTQEAQVLELPYRGAGVSMVVVLPNLPKSLKDLEKGIDGGTVRAWLACLRPPHRMRVHLPRFSVRADFSLKEPLEALGMKDAFGGAADFGGISRSQPLHLQAVAHEASVDVNEEGTVAVAATAAGLGVLSGPLPFRADRPFLFFIHEKSTGSILFMGRLVRPQAAR